MRLYSHTGAVAIDAPEGHFEPDEDGGFDGLDLADDESGRAGGAEG